MGFRFIGQPFPGAEQVGALLRNVLADDAYNSAWFATAWGKRSGLSRLVQAIEALKGRGGQAEAIIGVDEGGATVEGLQLALDLFDAAFVFHDPGPRTYHPKIYVVEGDDDARAIVGSGNLTRGGLFTNFEAVVSADIDKTNDADAEFLAAVRAYYERVRGLGPFCKQLTEQLIEDLQADPRVVVVSEQQANRQRAQRRGRGASSLFGKNAIPDLLGAPAPEVAAVPQEEEDDDAVVATVTASVKPRPVARWWKRMTASDAHRKPPTSHQRNYVALSQAGRGIDHKVWFREDLFNDHVAWATEPMRTGNVKEVAVVPFDVYVDDDYLGVYNITVDHAENRIANQNNAPTYLNWSSLLPTIRASDFRGWWLELTRMSDGTFRLRLLPEEPSAD